MGKLTWRKTVCAVLPLLVSPVIGSPARAFDGIVFSVALQPQDTLSINPGGIVNAADYAAQVAPGSMAAAFGNFPVPYPMWDAELPLATSMEGLSLPWSSRCAPGGGVCPAIAIAGSAPLFYVSGRQVNLQIPWQMAASVPGQMQWQNLVAAALNGQSSATQTVDVVPFAPAIFTMNAQGTGQGAILDSSYRVVDRSNPAGAGDYILIYCTGLGLVTNAPDTGAPALSNPLSWTTAIPTVTVGGAPAMVTFFGLAPGYVGLYQVNAQVPAGLAANDAAPVILSIGGVQSNTATIAVQ